MVGLTPGNVARHLAGVSLLCLAALALARPGYAQTTLSTTPSGAKTSTAAGTPASATALADDAEEIVVTGFRAAISAAADLKKNSSIILDSVTAEDIGKFPDANLAEALQRVPAVTIDRSGGEGRNITVRGFGPQFELVLLNGRTLGSDQNGREFSFDAIRC